MNNFSELRKLARDKRDEAIKAAREVYQGELESINQLVDKQFARAVILILAFSAEIKLDNTALGADA